MTGAHPRPAGFTFVELLIAATMISILFVGLGTHLRGGVEVWRQATSRGESLQQHRVAFYRIERDLANAVVYDDRQDAYGTDAGKLPRPEFGDNALAWFAVERPPEGLAAVRRVSYACQAVDGVSGLWRTSQSVAEARAKQEPEHQLLLPGCQRLTVEYAWKESGDSMRLIWAGPDDSGTLTLPGLIRMTLEFEAGKPLTRIYAVPAGTIPVAASS